MKQGLLSAGVPAQAGLPFQYEEEKSSTGITALSDSLGS